MKGSSVDGLPLAVYSTEDSTHSKMLSASLLGSLSLSLPLSPNTLLPSCKDSPN